MKIAIITATILLLILVLFYIIKAKKNTLSNDEKRFTKGTLIELIVIGLLGTIIGFSVVYKLENYICYALMYLTLSLLILKLSKYDLVSAPMLFLAFYTFIIGLSPIVLLWYGVTLHFDYYMYILLPLIFYVLALVICSSIEIKRKKKDSKKNKFGFIKRKNALRLLLYVSYAASIYFVLKNIDMYINNDIYAGRIDAISGSGMLVYISQLPIFIIPLFYEMLGKEKEGIKLWEFILYAVASSISLLVTGFRAPLILMLMVLTIMFIKKKQLKQSTIILIAVALIALVFGLDMLRGRNPLNRIYENGKVNDGNPIMVCVYNLNAVTANFPSRIAYQKGYTYLINLKMLKPGPDLDYTLWLKKKINYEFPGGGVTPTVNGEFYMNFGVVSMYIGFLLLGLLGFTANELSKKRKYDFFSTYLVVQYFHCISGGIANVMIPVLLMLIVYFAIHIFSYKGVKKYEQ